MHASYTTKATLSKRKMIKKEDDAGRLQGHRVIVSNESVNVVYTITEIRYRLPSETHRRTAFSMLEYQSACILPAHLVQQL